MEDVLHFALINNQRVSAAPKLKGVCPGCLQLVIAKCGPRRIWHWSHRTERSCDTWWERETKWHRDWKDNFPIEWQESIQHDETGEKHIADVRTKHGLVIEFQHSHIDPQERVAREHFYRNMTWVVNGTRIKRDYPRFLEGKSKFMEEVKHGVFLLALPNKCFPTEWLDSSVPVFFDFRGNTATNSPDRDRETLWCLLPGRAEEHAVVIETTYTDFVTKSFNNAQLLPAKEILSSVAEHIRQQRGRSLIEQVTEIEMKMQLLRQQEHGD